MNRSIILDSILDNAELTAMSIPDIIVILLSVWDVHISDFCMVYPYDLDTIEDMYLTQKMVNP